MAIPSIPTTKPPSWATDTTVTDGLDVGRTVRLAPGTSQANQGHLADTRTAARHANWLDGGLCDWTRRLALEALTKPTAQAWLSASSYQPGQLAAYDGAARLCLEFSGPAVEALGLELPQPVNEHYFASDEEHQGSVCAVLDDDQCLYGIVQTGTPSGTKIVRTQGVTSEVGMTYEIDAVNTAQIIGFVRTAEDTYLAWTSARVYRSTNGGIGWTEVTPGTAYGTTYGPAASDGVGRVVLGWLSSESSVSVMLSDDSGSSWTAVSVGSGTGCKGVCRVTDGFIIVTSTGATYLLSDGATTATLLDTVAGTAEIPAAPRTIASDGGVRTVCWSSDGRSYGVLVSVDSSRYPVYVPLVGGIDANISEVDVTYDGYRFWIKCLETGDQDVYSVWSI